MKFKRNFAKFQAANLADYKSPVMIIDIDQERSWKNKTILKHKLCTKQILTNTFKEQIYFRIK